VPNVCFSLWGTRPYPPPTSSTNPGLSPSRAVFFRDLSFPSSIPNSLAASFCSSGSLFFAKEVFSGCRPYLSVIFFSNLRTSRPLLGIPRASPPFCMHKGDRPLLHPDFYQFLHGILPNCCVPLPLECGPHPPTSGLFRRLMLLLPTNFLVFLSIVRRQTNQHPTPQPLSFPLF